jgi:predicted MFS family arabinose efflux permease
MLLGIIYVFIVVFQVAYEPPKNVLITESYSHPDWKQGFAFYAALTEFGWVCGLFLGFLFTLWGYSCTTLLTICITLSLIAFVLSAIFVYDPTLIFERGLVSLERSFSIVQRGVDLLVTLNHNRYDSGTLTRENVRSLCLGLMFFSLATSIFFTPLPVFFAQNLGLSTSTVFALFTVNSLGCLVGYILTKRNHHYIDETSTATNVSLIRGILVFALIFVSTLAYALGLLESIAVLVLCGFVYAYYSVSVLTISMEVIPRGKTGLFSALLGAGTAIGCLAGPFIAAQWGFQYTFITSAACFLISFVTFKIFAHSRNTTFM